ncbi:MAG: Hpt domain-containing protein [Rhodospirillum sp.]|nr:Hpt domain-containing protein [Rhodospirillum sp.]MCF8488848.1 Hpt domain-containing protein [Rhodospirillum sp.]MCF8500651.1 Hpt domain-containing protein [Rhodospirillum sp.]
MEDFSPYPIHDIEALEAIARETAPEIVPRLIEVFLKEGRRRREVIAKAAETRDRDILGMEAHALKSASASFGCLRLAAQTRAADAAYKASEDDTLFALAPLILASLEEAERILGSVRLGA